MNEVKDGLPGTAPEVQPPADYDSETDGALTADEKESTPAAAPQFKSMPTSGATGLRSTMAVDYFKDWPGGPFGSDIEGNKVNGTHFTGFRNLDKIQPFYPGLYFIGAESSLGKTTFALQLAERGASVMYFSLEQSRFELFSKSIVRGFYQRYRADCLASGKASSYPTPTAIGIRTGNSCATPETLAEQVNAYRSKVDYRMMIIDGDFAVTVEDIAECIEIMVKVGIRPVVFVDYLQIISPTLVNDRQPDTKTAIDHIVHALKTIQVKYDLTMVVVSSLNRTNYNTSISFEAFKETGAIEYTADVVWGLQLSVLRNPDYRKEKDPEKKDMREKAYAASPRSVDLLCLKNRFGVKNFLVDFDYYPAHDVFYPAFHKEDPLSRY